MMILRFRKPKLTNSFIERNVSIKQSAAIYQNFELRCNLVLICHPATNEMFCYQQFAVQFRVQSGQSLEWA